MKKVNHFIKLLLIPIKINEFFSKNRKEVVAQEISNNSTKNRGNGCNNSKFYPFFWLNRSKRKGENINRNGENNGFKKRNQAESIHHITLLCFFLHFFEKFLHKLHDNSKCKIKKHFFLRVFFYRTGEPASTTPSGMRNTGFPSRPSTAMSIP